MPKVHYFRQSEKFWRLDQFALRYLPDNPSSITLQMDSNDDVTGDEAFLFMKRLHSTVLLPTQFDSFLLIVVIFATQHYNVATQ
jgi:hypothetical protein